jgi:hypothetical protein
MKLVSIAICLALLTTGADARAIHGQRVRDNTWGAGCYGLSRAPYDAAQNSRFSDCGYKKMKSSGELDARRYQRPSSQRLEIFGPPGLNPITWGLGIFTW